MASETQPLLPTTSHTHPVHVPHLGVAAVMALIINKIIGTGIFSIPSLIYEKSGSVGISLLLWLLGGVITFSGLSVYLEFGLELPHNGGEKNYLQRVWRKPKRLIETIYAMPSFLLGISSANSYAFGKYVLFALGWKEVNDWHARWIACGVITMAVYLHICHTQLSTKIFTMLGAIKVLILSMIILIGALVQLNLWSLDYDKPDNFHNIWESYEDFQPNVYSYAVALLQVIYAFKGWENANYVLSEIKDPQKTLKFAAPLSVFITTVFYFLVNLSYFIVIPKTEYKDSGVLIAGIFFTKIFGESNSSKLLPILIALSNLGNIMAVSFSAPRITQELARENLIPLSSKFKDLRWSMFSHWLLTVLVLILPPNGDIYQFIINVSSYPTTLVNIFVTLGLFYLHWNADVEHWGKSEGHKWYSYWFISLIFLGANLFLAIFPLVPPPSTLELDGGYAYWAFPVTGLGIFGLGALFWAYQKYFLKSFK
ncbi:hypothetical protein WICPIJ_001646 [Wickerhamomyces pijperi]|uniref:Methionine permease n=1 Tax=Wickerhamomyces pijperi TaxID=599730 RepID=A0A9P8QDC5_WICPI|nr:hypothetical protein WICPIJ_001646 [Wickerhamomyces pijperi]